MTMFVNGVKHHPFGQMAPLEISSPSIDLGEMPRQTRNNDLLDNIMSEVAKTVAVEEAPQFRPVSRVDVTPAESQDRDMLVKQMMTHGSMTYRQIFAEMKAKGLMKSYNPLYFRKIREELGLVRPGPKPGAVKVKAKAKAEKKQLALPEVVGESLRSKNKKLTRDEIHQKREEVAGPLFKQGHNLASVYHHLKSLRLMNSYNPAILKRIKAASGVKGSVRMTKQDKVKHLVKHLDKTVKIKAVKSVTRTDELKQALERRQRQMLELMQEYGISKLEMTATGESKITLAEVVSFSV